VRVSIDNPTGEIKAMMTANAEILIDEHKSVLAVPEQAISYDAQKRAFVNVPDPKAKDGMRKVAVTVGLANGSNTEIASGLKEGDKVVLQQ
jgi:HlyD family secretion protein